MPAPRLSHRLTLERPILTPDGAGGWARSWQEVGRIWGAIKSSAGREGAVGERPASRVSHRIIVRRGLSNDEVPTADCRLRHGETVFAIHAVSDTDEDRGFLTLWAEKGPFS